MSRDLATSFAEKLKEIVAELRPNPVRADRMVL